MSIRHIFAWWESNDENIQSVTQMKSYTRQLVLKFYFIDIFGMLSESDSFFKIKINALSVYYAPNFEEGGAYFLSVRSLSVRSSRFDLVSKMSR